MGGRHHPGPGGSYGDQRLNSYDGDTGAVIYGGGGPNELMPGTHSWSTTGIAARGRIYVATDNKVYAFIVPGVTPAPTPTPTSTETPTPTPTETQTPNAYRDSDRLLPQPLLQFAHCNSDIDTDCNAHLDRDSDTDSNRNKQVTPNAYSG